MPPLSKKLKVEANSPSKKSDELETFQNEIRIIKGMTEESQEEYENSFLEDSLESQNNVSNQDDIKKYIREQIRSSERRILQRCDRIEVKLNRLLERQCVEQIEEEGDLEEEHLVEYIEPESAEPRDDPSELDNQIFPIADEETFDWFFEKLRQEDYRDALILRRWQLTRSCSPKSVNIAVKDFLRYHFTLPVVVKYSVSGFGAHGVRKKKLDSNSLIIYVHECFNRSVPCFYTYQDVSKAIVQFWGRAPDNLSKAKERAMKRDPL
jgi:hypothetical protein